MKAFRILLAAPLALTIPALAQTPPPQPDAKPLQEPPPVSTGARTGAAFGHSAHGQAFDEGPRGRAYLMKGMPAVRFPVTTKNRTAQKFVEQGIGQLHGYWYFEAERSFRQAAALDADLAMAYWGMAMANFGNEKRAVEFIDEAKKRAGKASQREQMYIDALYAYMHADQKMPNRQNARRIAFREAMKAVSSRYPDDLEALALYSHEMLETKFADKNQKNEDADKVMNQVLAKDPMHPVHHYRIHLWNYTKDQNAINSAANCGPSSPGIAHMWHMQGHTYTVLDRFLDAAYSQEASARVDHAYMRKDLVMPDQIHNYAHNNQWLVETLEFTGRVREALALAKNMLDIPRHPLYNNPDAFGSAGNGRVRLIETLFRYELWPEAQQLDRDGYIEPGSTPAKQNDRLRLLAVAAFAQGDIKGGDIHLAELQKRLAANTGNDFLKSAVAEASVYKALAQGDRAEAQARIPECRNLFKDREARLWMAAGDPEKAEAAAREAVKTGPNETAPLATLVDILARNGKTFEAGQRFEELRAAASTADLDTPLLARLQPLAAEMGYSTDWRAPQKPPSDTGSRPPLESLGPFTWQPPAAPDFTLKTVDGRTVSLSDFRRAGRPLLMLFYLGGKCAPCMEQLNTFAPLHKEFEAAGITLMAVTAEGMEEARKSLKTETGWKVPFPVLCDPSRKIYKKYRAYDDFEDMPLHGAYLVDGQGYLRWLDIRFEPFRNAAFLLNESRRLISRPLNPRQASTTARRG